MKPGNVKGQGSLEYLLLIGGGVIVAIIVIMLLLGTIQAAANSLRGVWGTGLSTITGEEVTVTFPIGSLVVNDSNPTPSINYSTPFSGAASSAIITFDFEGWNVLPPPPPLATHFHCFFIDGNPAPVYSEFDSPTGTTDGSASTPQIVASIGPGNHTFGAASGPNADCSGIGGAPPYNMDDYAIKNAKIQVTFTA